MTTEPGRKENSLYTGEIPWLPEEEVEKNIGLSTSRQCEGKAEIHQRWWVLDSNALNHIHFRKGRQLGDL